MKKVILMLGLMSGFATMAQNEGSPKGRMNQMANMTLEQMATLQTKRMTLALDLSDAQQKQVEKINLDNAELWKTKMEAHKAKKKNSEIKKPTSEERYTKANQFLDHQIAQKKKMKQILNKEQYEKWAAMEHKKGKHLMKKRRHHNPRKKD